MAVAHASQTESLLSRLPQPGALDGNEAKVMLRSPLQMTLDREEALLSHVNDRREQLSREGGRLNFWHSGWIRELAVMMRSDGRTVMPFHAIRHLGHLMMEGRVDWRKMMQPESLWSHSNFHLPLIGRIVPQQIARAVDYYFGTSPWVTASPVGAEDQDLSEKITQFARHEIDQKGLEGVLRDAVSLAFIQGEQVVKTSYQKQLTFYETIKHIALLPNGEPFIALDGDYVYEGVDTFVPQVPAADPMQDPEAPPPPATAQPLVLKRDMQTPQPAEALTFAWKKIDRVNTTYDGAKSQCVHHLDFLCPFDAPNVQDADMVVHIRSEPLIRFVHQLLTDEWNTEQTPIEQRKDTLSRLLSELGTNSSRDSLAMERQPRAELQEGSAATATPATEPQLTLAEHWLHYDIDGSGIQRSIVCITTADGKHIIYYDYAENMTHDGLRPFDVLRVNPVPGRWHGIGQPAKFFELQMLADLLLNRINFSQMQSARVDFWRPELTVEGQQDQNLKLNWGKTYRLADISTDPGKVLHSVYLTNIKAADLHQLLELVMQVAMNMSGIMNVNDSNMAGLDTAKLATGVKNLERSGQELFGKFLSDLTPAIQATVKRFLKVTIQHMKGKRVFRFFNGDVSSLAEINPHDLTDIDLDITIELSRYTGQQKAAEQDAAWAVLMEYLGLPPDAKVIAYPFTLDRLKSFGVKNPEKKLPKPIDPALMPPAPTGAPTASSATQPAEPPDISLV